MSLEEELVFELMDKQNTSKDIREIVEHMRDPEFSKCNPVVLNKSKIETAIKRYELLKEYNHQKNGGKKEIYNKIKKEKEQKLISIDKKIKKRIEKIIASDPEILTSSIQIKKSKLDWRWIDCNPFSFLDEVIDYLREKCEKGKYQIISLKGKRFFKNKEGIIQKEKFSDTLLRYCKRCGYMERY